MKKYLSMINIISYLENSFLVEVLLILSALSLISIGYLSLISILSMFGYGNISKLHISLIFPIICIITFCLYLIYSYLKVKSFEKRIKKDDLYFMSSVAKFYKDINELYAKILFLNNSLYELGIIKKLNNVEVISEPSLYKNYIKYRELIKNLETDKKDVEVLYTNLTDKSLNLDKLSLLFTLNNYYDKFWNIFYLLKDVFLKDKKEITDNL